MTTTGTSRIAVGQLRSTSDKLKSLLDAAYCATEAKRNGAVMLFLPENFGFMGLSPDETIHNAESLTEVKTNPASVMQMIQKVAKSVPDRSYQSYISSEIDNQSISLLDGLRTIASESGLWISACMHTAGAPPSKKGRQRVYNTHIIMNDSGAIKATYHKIHLFDLSIPGEIELCESNSTAPGSEIVVCDSPIGRLGLSTCYDIRFPQLYTAMVDRGARVILIPAAFTVPTGRAHWHTLLRARAIEAQCYVIAAAQFGEHNAKRVSYGHSLVVDPWGVVIADAGGMDSPKEDVKDPPSLIYADIDLERLDVIRQRMPVQDHRTNAIY